MRLTEQERKEVEKILVMTLPRIYYGPKDNIPFVGGMHFLIREDAEGNAQEIHECRGYHRRKIIKIVDNDWILVNPLSEFAEGVFQSRITSLNQFSNSPLIQGVYKRRLMDGWVPDEK